MNTLRIDICYRPLRVGWAVRRGDFDSLRRIVRWSHTLWGGRHNPIVVAENADNANRVPELVIMRRTGHRSLDTVRKYIRERTLVRDRPTTRLGL